MAKLNKREELAQQERLQMQAAEQQRREEEEKARKRDELLALAKQQEEVVLYLMDKLVEHDAEPGMLQELAENGMNSNIWYLRYIVVERLGRQILLNVNYSQKQLQSWLIPYAILDEKTYVRRAAIKHLTDISALAKSSSEDPEPIVRKKAIEQLFLFLDQPAALQALNYVSLNDPEPDLRHMAVLRIVDQNVIAQVAKTDTVPDIRKSATQKLEHQEDLAWIAINDTTLLVRSAAAERMTDVKALVDAALNVKLAPDTAPQETASEPMATLEPIGTQDIEEASA